MYLIKHDCAKISLVQKRLFVAGLPFSSTEDELKDHFSGAGKVVSVKIITDRDSGRSKGFGFIEFETEEEAANAIKMYHDSDYGGRKLAVAEAKPQEPRDNRGYSPRNDDRRGGGGYSNDRRGGNGRDKFSRGGGGYNRGR
jgi:cold-inducible RNA-binding protein